MLERLEALTRLHGISGYEDRVRAYIRGELNDLASQARIDRLGNLYVQIGSGSPHAVFAAHMDEIGMVVTHIEESGGLRFRLVGGLDKRVLPGRYIHIDTGKETVTGVIGLIPPHLFRDDADRNRVFEPDDLVIDVGAASRGQVEALGIAVRNPAILAKDFVRLPNGLLSARSLDDRAGCAMLLDVLEAVKRESLKGRITFAWTVQEEVGLRGATALATALKADIVFPVDTLSAGDIHGLPFHRSPAVLGKGPALRFLDVRAIASPRLIEAVLALAGREGIPVQVAATGGGTDGAAFQLEGCSMLPIAFPIRYTHSPVEVASIEDMERTVALLGRIALHIDELDRAARPV